MRTEIITNEPQHHAFTGNAAVTCRSQQAIRLVIAGDDSAPVVSIQLTPQEARELADSLNNKTFADELCELWTPAPNL